MSTKYQVRVDNKLRDVVKFTGRCRKVPEYTQENCNLSLSHYQSITWKYEGKSEEVEVLYETGELTTTRRPTGAIELVGIFFKKEKPVFETIHVPVTKSTWVRPENLYEIYSCNKWLEENGT